MSGNLTLARAKAAKSDEFYTRLADIEDELKHYREHFKGKTVLCNCDDPFESNFFKYFVLNFNRLGLKKLISTSYTFSRIAGKELKFSVPYKAVVTSVRDATGNGAVSMEDVVRLFESGENELEKLTGDGDFRSPECLTLLDEADIVCTNPPFSLFREYIGTMLEHDKKFLVIGNQNAITYKEIFPLLKNDQVWLGYRSGNMSFTVPDDYEPRKTRYWQDETGQKWRSMGNVCWFTDLDIKKRHEGITPVFSYDPERYPKFDNYDIIDVDRVSDIPYNYEGVMGVPVTFMDRYDPDQFEITDGAEGIAIPGLMNNPKDTVVNGKSRYARVLIRYTDGWIASHPDDFKERQYGYKTA